MAEHLHPSLVRLYTQAATEDSFLFIDESYSVPDEYGDSSFYILSAVRIQFGNLEGTRRTLRDIAQKGFWHTTDELRSSDGRKRTVAMLEQFYSWGDEHLISVEAPLNTANDLEQARGDCLRALVAHAYSKPDDSPPAGIIFEKRLRQKDDNRDRRLIKKLKLEGLLPKDTGVAWVSPSDEQLLWAPISLA